VEQVPFRYWLDTDAPGAYVDLSAEGEMSMKNAQQWWLALGWVSVGCICSVYVFAWWHQRRLREIFRVQAESLDEGQSAAQLTLEESYETMTKGSQAHWDNLGSYAQNQA
jgi:hypothetical protein